MGLRHIEGKTSSGSKLVVMYCSTSGWAFGPIFETVHKLEAFKKYGFEQGTKDLRELSPAALETLHIEWCDASVGQFDDNGYPVAVEPADGVHF